MCAAQCLDETHPTPDAYSPPFGQVVVTLSKQEHIQLVTGVNYWRFAHQRAIARQQWLELQHRRALEQAALREATLRSELEHAQAKIRELEQRLFGRKTERVRIVDSRLRQRGDAA